MATIVLPDAWSLEAQMSVGGETWKNAIELRNIVPLTDVPPAPTDDIITAWQTFVTNIHYNDVTIDQLTLRPLLQVQGVGAPATHPPIWQVPVGVPGAGNTTWGGAHNSNYMPADVCIFAKKATSGGRAGKNFFRNILTEVDVASTLNGAWSFTSGAGHFQATLFNGEAVTDLGPFFGDTPSTGAWVFCVAHLLNLPTIGDVREAYTTPIISMTALRPVWNRARR